MGIIAAWDNKSKATLRYIHYGSWHWGDLDRAVEDAQIKLRYTRQTVHIIVDLRESAALPPEPTLRQKSVLTMGQGKGQLIFVGVGALTWPYYDVMRRIYRSRRTKDAVHFVETLEDARALLQTEVHAG